MLFAVFHAITVNERFQALKLAQKHQKKRSKLCLRNRQKSLLTDNFPFLLTFVIRSDLWMNHSDQFWRKFQSTFNHSKERPAPASELVLFLPQKKENHTRLEQHEGE